MHKHTLRWHCDNYVSLTKAGLTINVLVNMIDWMVFYTSFNSISVIPFPNKSWFIRVCSISLLKPLQEKEKLLVTSNFSFSHSVFYPFWQLSAIFIKLNIVVCKLFQFGRASNVLFGKRLYHGDSILVNPFPNEPCFDMSTLQVFWRHCGKKRNCFWRKLCHLHQI